MVSTLIFYLKTPQGFEGLPMREFFQVGLIGGFHLDASPYTHAQFLFSGEALYLRNLKAIYPH